jgi:hypothetical protein
MTRPNRIKAIVGGLLIVVGVLLAVLPKDWIEETFGVEPDAGSGVLELAFVLVPTLVGLFLLSNLFLSYRRQRAERALTTEG